jgi:hypothetical protein
MKNAERKMNSNMYTCVTDVNNDSKEFWSPHSESCEVCLHKTHLRQASRAKLRTAPTIEVITLLYDSTSNDIFIIEGTIAVNTENFEVPYFYETTKLNFVCPLC